jgi:hypothetical protein
VPCRVLVVKCHTVGGCRAALRLPSPAPRAGPHPACRRAPAGKETVNSLYGTRVAVLAGDFLFAQSSWFLANLDNMEVCGWGC